MPFIENLQQFFTLITLPTIIGAALYIGRRLQVLDNLDTTMTIMKNNIKIISNALIVSGTIEWDGTLLRDYSPLTLTEEGRQFLEKTDFFDIFNQHGSAFLTYIQAEQPKTKYDVEALATQSIIFHADADFMEPLKVWLYNNPKESLQRFAKVAGVYVRDQYLAQHPEITA